MTFLKRFVSVIISAATLATALAMPAAAAGSELAEPYSLTGQELIQRIEETYDDALRLAGRWSFHGKCSTMVNRSVQVLGIVNERPRLDGHGRDSYNMYSAMGRTTGGYDTVCYPRGEYDLESALNAVCENGTRDVYNLIVGFQGGRTGSSGSYGHTLFVHGILNGMVYFSESYGLYLAGRYYREGDPIVCTVAEFANYYNKWAYFEGVVHLDFPDETAPAMSRLAVVETSGEGFTLRCRAADNIGIVEMYAKVWPYGSDEESARLVNVTNANGAVMVRIDTEMFAGYDDVYYVNLYAVDRKGNVSVVTTDEKIVSLYPVRELQGTYRIQGGSVGIYDVPAARVNNTDTLRSALAEGTEVRVVGYHVSESGEAWYELADGGWIRANGARRLLVSWADLLTVMSYHYSMPQL